MSVNAGEGRSTRPGLREETACALCGQHRYTTIATRDRDGRPLTTVMCDLCGLVWTNPRPSDEDVDRYYARDYRADYARRRAPSVRKVLRGLLGAEERREALGSLLAPGARVLDVGCGAGELVFLLRRRGIEAAGIEPGEEFADFSRRVLGIPIQTATVETALVEPGSQHLITMFHMLEHVADPRRVLATVRGWLRQGGRLVVEVPNVESRAQAPAHRFHFAHLYNFNAATLKALGDSVGLTPIRSFESPDGGNVTAVFERADGQPHVVAALPENVTRTGQALAGHTTARHYLSATPYRRVVGRLVRRLQEDRLLWRLPTMEACLEWATAGPLLARNRSPRLH
jgi:SAM-dependent methyltransferase